MFEWQARGRRITIREVRSEELKTVEDIQRQAWGFEDLDVVPAAQLIAAQHVGGILLGAFDETSMIGFVYGFPGYEQGRISMHSHLLAVRPDCRGLRAGLFLKLAQREAALDRGIIEITWTFDPLQSVNANLNFSALGVTSRRYVVNFYGEATSSPLHQGIGTDRLWVSWMLDTERVQERVARAREGKPPLPALDVTQFGPSLVEWKRGCMEGPGQDLLSGNSCRIEIPDDIMAVSRRDSQLGPLWRQTTRLAFLQALDRGFVVADFHGIQGPEGRRWFYHLTKPDEGQNQDVNTVNNKNSQI